MTDSNDMLRRAQGCLFGQLIGDALGARYEFKSDSQVAAMVDEDRENNGFLPILGGGPFNMKPGQVTDDSEMALSLARSLVDLKKFSAPDIAASYVAWIQSNPPDRGITTEHALLGKGESQKVGPDFRMALSKEQKERLWEEVKKRVHEWNANSLSNGALMRISPLGIATTRWNDERRIRRCVDEDVGMTHCHDLVKETVFAYVMAIRFLIKGESTEDAFNAALNSVHSRWARQCLLDSKKHANPVKLTDGREIYGDKEKIGFIGVALQGAFHELLHANTFAEGVERAVLRGGDTDTNGCIAAALLGAKFGEDGIPEEWKKSVKKAKRRDPTYSHLKTDDAKDLARRLLEEVEECD
ncbi:hypothetical protein L596_014574 [Steinernema carpocapsae]|uniref:ADP-ribosylhydrolase ARH3 n=1 Tax=Steinernema carpocapsae TaxID=34508 RepID=A0A4U5ND39_STECR|nr:hypothetical protein L596_014574 [Steinernema carpocapsae]